MNTNSKVHATIISLQPPGNGTSQSTHSYRPTYSTIISKEKEIRLLVINWVQIWTSSQKEEWHDEQLILLLQVLLVRCTAWWNFLWHISSLISFMVDLLFHSKIKLNLFHFYFLFSYFLIANIIFNAFSLTPGATPMTHPQDPPP